MQIQVSDKVPPKAPHKDFPIRLSHKDRIRTAHKDPHKDPGGIRNPWGHKEFLLDKI